MKKLHDYKEFTEAQNRYNEQSTALREIQAERENVHEQLLSTLRAGQDKDARALALLRGEFVNPEPLRQQLVELDAELPVRQRAVELAEQQLESVRGRISHEICAEARKDFIPHVQKIVDALKSIRAANKALADLRSGLEASGVKTGSIPFCIFQRVGTEEDHKLGQSPLAIYIKDIQKQFPEVK